MLNRLHKQKNPSNDLVNYILDTSLAENGATMFIDRVIGYIRDQQQFEKIFDILHTLVNRDVFKKEYATKILDRIASNAKAIKDFDFLLEKYIEDILRIPGGGKLFNDNYQQGKTYELSENLQEKLINAVKQPILEEEVYDISSFKIEKKRSSRLQENAYAITDYFFRRNDKAYKKIVCAASENLNYSMLPGTNIWGMAFPNYIAIQERRKDGISTTEKDRIGLIVTLTQEEIPSSWLNADIARTGSIKIYRQPIKSFDEKTNTKIMTILEKMKERIDAGEKVVIHCTDGKGLTGIVLACWLIVEKNMKAAEAIAEVQKARPGSIETEEHQKVIMTFETYYREQEKTSV